MTRAAAVYGIVFGGILLAAALLPRFQSAGADSGGRARELLLARIATSSRNVVPR
jgi:hypothetical protein